MLAYYLPLGWFYKTRIKTFSAGNIMRIFMNYFFVVLSIVLIKFSLSTGSVISYIISMVCMFSIYECGYIFNDVITVQYENKPTFRFRSYDELKILEKHIQNLITIRMVYFLLGLLWFKIFSDYFFGEILVIAINSTFLLIVYSIHNYLRSSLNAVTFFVLINLKYILPLSFFLPMSELMGVYPFIFFTSIVDQSLLTFASKSYLGLGKMKIDYDKFRAIYFLCEFVFSVVLYLSSWIQYSYMCAVSFVALYRIGGYYLAKKMIINVERL